MSPVPHYNEREERIAELCDLAEKPTSHRGAAMAVSRRMARSGTQG